MMRQEGRFTNGTTCRHNLSAQLGTTCRHNLSAHIWLAYLCLFLALSSLFSSPSFSQISVALHASWDNDLTDNNPGYCVTSGTVAIPYFHFIAAYQYPVIKVSVDWYRVEELPEQHIPGQAQFDNQ
ncbi:MAG: hypothetical protein NZ937_07735 [Armatimonadetes bacterium]|nr:hypothetical protein [Armatimonadota bacterium]